MSERHLPALPPDFPTDLPRGAAADLPANYRSAMAALRECDQVDQCKDWADKAAALAAYAHLARNYLLELYARRIRLRSFRRAGELLAQVDPAPGGRTPVGGHKSSGRTAAAITAGLSGHYQAEVLRIANVPKDTFEELVESERPPSVTDMARLGTGPSTRRSATVVSLHPIRSAAPATRPKKPNVDGPTYELIDAIEGLIFDFDWIDVEAAVKGLDPGQFQQLAASIAVARARLDGLRKAMGIV